MIVHIYFTIHLIFPYDLHYGVLKQYISHDSWGGGGVLQKKKQKIKPYGTPSPHITLIFQQGISIESEAQQLLGVLLLKQRKKGGGGRGITKF